MQNDCSLPLFSLNGKLIQSLSLTDRAFHYGDGLFETIAVQRGSPQLLADHLKRLAVSAKKLNISLPSQQEISEKIFEFLQRLVEKHSSFVLKIIATRGSGGRGYSPPIQSTTRLILGAYPWPVMPHKHQEQGIDAFICQTRVSYNQSLAGMKHLNRLEQVMASAEFSTQQYQEGLMLDPFDNLIEGTKSNLFFIDNGCLLTPRLTHCGVAGIMRQTILKLAKQLGIKSYIEVIPIAELETFSEIFICNSIIKALPIKSIMGKHYKVGDVTRQLIEHLDKKLV